MDGNPWDEAFEEECGIGLRTWWGYLLGNSYGFLIDVNTFGQSALQHEQQLRGQYYM